VTGRRGRIPQQLLDDLKKKGEYWKLEEEALSLWWTRFGKGYGPVVRQTTISSIGCPNKSARFNFLIKRIIYSKSVDIFISV